MRIAIIGTGRMGRTLAALATEKGHTIVAQVARPSESFWDSLTAEVVIDFSHASQVPSILKHALAHRIPLITGTTGWYEDLPALRSRAATQIGTRWLWGGNFSRGIALLKVAIRSIVTLWDAFTDWEALLIETHHRHKKDAPSGTAIELAKAFPAVKAIQSLRVGEVVGEHTLLLSGPGEEVSLLHRAHDRRIFAEGALWAAEWLLRQSHFVGSFEEALLSGLNQQPG